jgi:ribosome-associated protein
MIHFELEDDYIALHRLLKATGVCESGGMAKMLITEGFVRVDGEVELRKRCKVRRGQRVEFENRVIAVD